MSNEIHLSVAMITFNEEKNLARSLDSVRDIADEIIIVDSHSTDETEEIAKKYKARFIRQDWQGFGPQKNIALENCNGDWILNMDADEVLSEKLKGSIKKVLNGQSNVKDLNGAYINRKTFYLGKFLDYSWQPEWKLRLVRRSAGPRWNDLQIHESLQVDGKKIRLRGDLYHYSYVDMADHFNKTVKYSLEMAKHKSARNKRASVLNLVLNPFFAFFKNYFLHLGFLDGRRGFVVAVSSALARFLKYAFLWELHLQDVDQNKQGDQKTGQNNANKS